MSPRDREEGGRCPPVLPVGGILGRMYRRVADGSLFSGAPRHPISHTSPTQAATSEAPQDVTYAQLNHSTLRRGTATPPGPPVGEPLAEPSEHVALTIR